MRNLFILLAAICLFAGCQSDDGEEPTLSAFPWDGEYEGTLIAGTWHSQSNNGGETKYSGTITVETEDEFSMSFDTVNVRLSTDLKTTDKSVGNMNFLLKVNRLGEIVAINDVHGEYVKWRCNGDFEENTLEFSTGWSTSGTYVSYEYTGVKKHPMPGNRLTDRFWYDYRDKWVGDYICNGYYKYYDDSVTHNFRNGKVSVKKIRSPKLIISLDSLNYRYRDFELNVKEDGSLYYGSEMDSNIHAYIKSNRIYLTWDYAWNVCVFTGYRQH